MSKLLAIVAIAAATSASFLARADELSSLAWRAGRWAAENGDAGGR